MNYAAAEHHIAPGVCAVNLTDQEIEFDSVHLPRCPESIYNTIKHNLVSENGKFLLKPAATQVIVDFTARDWNLLIFVDKDVYSAIRSLTKRSEHLALLYRRVVCNEFKDSLGNFV